MKANMFLVLILTTAANALQFPLAGYNVTGYEFGQTTSNGIHLGEDAIGNNTPIPGTPVYSIGGGTVKWSQAVNGYGNAVVIEHQLTNGNTVCSVYGHLSPQLTVSSNQIIPRGQLLGYLGTTAENGGYAPHLHFGIYIHPAPTQWVFYGYANPQTGANFSDWSDPTDFINNNQNIDQVTVTWPVSGVTLYREQTYTVRWETNNEPGRVRVFVKQNGVPICTLAANDANDGALTFNPITSIFPIGQNYIIQVQMLQSGNYGDSPIFPIQDPTGYVTSPSEGAIWYRGTEYSITWDPSRFGVNDPIRICVDNNTNTEDGFYYDLVATTAPNNGIHLFVPLEEWRQDYYYIYVQSNTPSMNYGYSGRVFFADPSSVGDVAVTVPKGYSVNNHPNPFNARTTIEYTIPKTGKVDLKVFDVSGREVATLVDFHQNPGTYKIAFDGTSLAAGTYFLRLQSGTFSQTQKMVLLK